MLPFFVSKYKGLYELTETKKIIHDEDSNIQLELESKNVEGQFNNLNSILGKTLVYCHALILLF